MARHHSVGHRLGEIVLVALVAVGVVTVSAAVRANLQGTSPAAADELSYREIPAMVSPGGSTQVLSPAGWDVSLTLPYTADMGAVLYAFHGKTSIGLSTSNLSAFGPACAAARNGLGTLVRFREGSWDQATKGNPRYYRIITLNGYDYGYEAPLNDCTSNPAAQTLVNRQFAALLESFGTQPLR